MVNFIVPCKITNVAQRKQKCNGCYMSEQERHTYNNHCILKFRPNGSELNGAKHPCLPSLFEHSNW
jgi:hypothetical protein